MGFLYGPMGFLVFRSAEVVASIGPGPVGLDASVDGRGLRHGGDRRRASGQWTSGYSPLLRAEAGAAAAARGTLEDAAGR